MADTTADIRRDDAKAREILKAARKHFITEGYASAAMEAIAREAGVSTATLYLYFPGKAELFRSVILDASRDFGAAIDEIRKLEGDAREQLRAFAHAYAQFLSEPFVRAIFRLVMAERKRFQATAQHFFDYGRAHIGAVLMGILTQLEEAGEIRVEKPSWAAGQLMGMIEHPVFFVPLVTGDEVKAARALGDIAEDAVETFMSRYGTAGK